MVERTWFPSVTQIFVMERKNTNYFHSLWVGITAPIINLPYLFWLEVLRPMLTGILTIIKLLLLTFIAGLAGNVFGAKEKQ